MTTFLKIKSLSIIFILLFFNQKISIGLDLQKIKERAIYIVHADLYDFYYTDSLNFKNIQKSYNLIELKSSGFDDCIFFEIKSVDCTICKECSFLIVYWHSEKRYFRVSGFRFSEFTFLYNFVLLEKYLSNNKLVALKKIRKAILPELWLEGYNISDMYFRYYGKYENLKNSCFQKMIIRVYD